MPQSLDERVTDLERRLAELKSADEKGSRQKNWQRTVGMFTGDDVMQRIDEAARQYREADRAKARRRSRRTQRAKR